MARKMYNGCRRSLPSLLTVAVSRDEVVVVDVEFVAMMSGGGVDVEPFLISRNTLGNGKTVDSKSQIANGKWV